MSVLRHRDFAILLAGQLVSTVGNNLFTIAVPWFVYTETGSKTALALAGVAMTLPSLAGMFAGVWVDRWRKRPTMIASDVARAGLSFLLFGVTAAGAPVGWVFGLVLVMQLTGAFFSPAAMSLLPRLVPREEIPAATGLIQSGSGLAQFAGLVAGGALLSLLGAPLLFLLNGLSFVVSVTSLLFIRVREEAVERRGASGLVEEWLAGLRLGFRSRLILRILLAACVANFALVPLDIILTAWVKGPLHGGSILLGVMNGGFAAGAIAGGIVLGAVAKRVQLKAILAGGLTALGVCVGAVGLWPNAVWDTSLIVVGGVSVGLLNGSLSALFLSVVPESMRGRMAGALGAFSTFTGPVGVSLFGALMVHLPLAALWILIGGLVVASGLSFFVPVENDVQRVLAAAATGG